MSARQFWRSQPAAGGVGNEMLLPSSGWRPGLLLTPYSARDARPQQRILWNKMPMVPRSRSSSPSLLLIFKLCISREAYQWHSTQRYLNITKLFWGVLLHRSMCSQKNSHNRSGSYSTGNSSLFSCIHSHGFNLPLGVWASPSQAFPISQTNINLSLRADSAQPFAPPLHVCVPSLGEWHRCWLPLKWEARTAWAHPSPQDHHCTLHIIGTSSKCWIRINHFSDQFRSGKPNELSRKK